jgi:hypothetical protein
MPKLFPPSVEEVRWFDEGSGNLFLSPPGRNSVCRKLPNTVLKDFLTSNKTVGILALGWGNDWGHA